MHRHVGHRLVVLLVVAPGRGVEHRGLAVGEPELGTHRGAHGGGVGAQQQVVARVAGLPDRAVEAEGLAEPRAADRVGGEQHVPAGDVEVQVVEPARWHQQHVVVDPLERGAVPGLQVRRARRTWSTPPRCACRRPPGRRTRGPRGRRGSRSRRCGRRREGRRVRRVEQPGVLGAGPVPEPLVDGPRVVGEAAVEAVVDDVHQPASVRRSAARRRRRRPRRRTPGRASGTRPRCRAGPPGRRPPPPATRRPARSPRWLASRITGRGQFIPRQSSSTSASTGTGCGRPAHRDRRSPTTPGRTASSRSTSAAVVSRPRETRTLPWVSAPIAASTCDGSRRAGGAGRAGRHREAVPVELGDQGLALDVEAGEGQHVGEPVHRVADHVDVRDRGQSGAQPVHQRPLPRADLSRSASTACSAAAAASTAGTFSKPATRGSVRSSDGERRPPAGALAHQQHAHPRRAAPLVRRRRRRRPARGQVHAARRGRRVGEQRDVVPGRHLRGLGDRLEGADLGVRDLQGDHAGRSRGRLPLQVRQPARARRRRRSWTSVEVAAPPAPGRQHRRVLHGRVHQPGGDPPAAHQQAEHARGGPPRCPRR